MTGLRLHYRRASLLSFAVAPLVSLSLTACTKKQERAPRPTATVSVAPAKRATVPYVIEANGTVTPMQSVSVVPQVDGIILTVDFQEGEEVRAGQPLFHIDPRPYQNAYDAAIAVLARDSANAAHAKAEVERYDKLLAAKVVTPQEAAVQTTAFATADATVRQDQAALESAKFNLENTVIRAPIAGKTGSLLVKRGNLVRGAGAASLVVINQVRPILVRFAIPSSQLPLVLQYGAKGGLPVAAVPGGIAPASPSIDSLAAAATQNPIQDAPAGTRGGTDGAGAAGAGGNGGSTGGFGPPRGPGASNGGGNGGGGKAGGFSGAANGSIAQQGTGITGDRMMGKLSFIDNAVDTTTGTVQLKAVFENANGRLWAGQFASTSLHLFDEDSALVVPAQAVVTGQRGAYVYVVDQADTARQKGVTVERMAGGLAVISSGIREGDRVVIDGMLRLQPDVGVRIRGADGAGGGGGRRGGGGGGRGKGRGNKSDKGGNGGT
jgi:multidrug efflux pump subunit AcrA (membrane-fusion protein)